MIYFIQDSRNLDIKIGLSNNVPSRLAALQTASPNKLVLLATCDGGRDVEAELHNRFAKFRKEGEWFSPSPPILKYLAGLKYLDSEPRTTGPINNFYLAGKMQADPQLRTFECWRLQLVDDYANLLCDGELGESAVAPIRPSAINGRIRRYNYTGPYYFNDLTGHHGDTVHGSVETYSAYRHLARFCFDAIANCDALFAWVDGQDCYGTFAEVGLANALGKFVFIGGPRRFPDLDFIYSMATIDLGKFAWTRDAREAFYAIENGYFEAGLIRDDRQ